jgi:hypothetical protein
LFVRSFFFSLKFLPHTENGIFLARFRVLKMQQFLFFFLCEIDSYD